MYLAEDDFAGRASETLRLLGVFESALARRRAAEIECARALAGLDDLAAWTIAGCISAADLGERYAMPASEARNLLGCGKAMKAYPYLEQQVRGGKITVPSAACLGEVFSNPALQKEDDDWLGWARTEPTQALRKRVQQRQEELRIEVPPVPVTVFVSSKTRDDFHRARTIASRKAARALTEGETFACVVDHYLDCYDDVRTQPGTRRLPDTAFVNGRYVPMSVRREIYLRQGENCAIPFCTNAMFIEYAHVVAHACGGSREADNLVLLCSKHHFEFDCGTFQLAGTAAQPKFLDRWGRDLTDRFDLNDQSPWWNQADLRDPPKGMKGMKGMKGVKRMKRTTPSGSPGPAERQRDRSLLNGAPQLPEPDGQTPGPEPP